MNTYRELVCRAQAERSAAIGEMIATVIAKTWFGLKRLTAAIAAGSVKLRDRTAAQLATAR
jgi:hypothetical protein